jgi:hypothetical protein
LCRAIADDAMRWRVAKRDNPWRLNEGVAVWPGDRGALVGDGRPRYRSQRDGASLGLAAGAGGPKKPGSVC